MASGQIGSMLNRLTESVSCKPSSLASGARLRFAVVMRSRGRDSEAPQFSSIKLKFKSESAAQQACCAGVAAALKGLSTLLCAWHSGCQCAYHCSESEFAESIRPGPPAGSARQPAAPGRAGGRFRARICETITPASHLLGVTRTLESASPSPLTSRARH
jgi:hypothetical protein